MYKKVYFVSLLAGYFFMTGLSVFAMRKTEVYDKHNEIFINAVETDQDFITFQILDDVELVKELSTEDKKYALGCAIAKDNKDVVSQMHKSSEFMKGIQNSCEDWTDELYRGGVFSFVFQAAVKCNRENIVLFILKKPELIKKLSDSCKKCSCAHAVLNKNQKLLLHMFAIPGFTDVFDLSLREMLFRCSVAKELKSVVRAMRRNKKFMEGIVFRQSEKPEDSDAELFLPLWVD